MRRSVATLGLTWALFACGDDGGATPDAMGGDAAADAHVDAPVDASAAPVTIRVAYGGENRAGVDVYFQNADASLVAKVATDANGVASATMEPGGYVTAVNPWESKGDTLLTFAGVKPGDELDLTNGSGFTTTNVDVTLPAAPDATRYEWHSTCGGVVAFTSTTRNVTLSNCGSEMDVMVVAFDDSMTPLGSFARTDVAVTANIVLTDTYSPVPDTTITLTNVPAGYTGASVYTTLATSRGVIYGDLVTPTLTGTTAAVTFKRPPFPGATSLVQTTLAGGPANAGTHIVVDWGPITAPLTFDLANTLLVTQTSLPVFDASAHAMTWGAGAGVMPDLIRTSIYANRDAGPSWEWRLVAPFTGPSVTFPELPAEIATFNITATDTVEVSEASTLKAPGGYDAARAHMHSIGDLRDLSPGVSGRIVYHDLARN